MTWSPKRAGFESGTSGNSSYGKPRKRVVNVVLDLWGYRASIIASLINDGIEYKDEPDGSILAFLNGAWRKKSFEMLKQDHEDYLKKVFR